MLKLITGLLKAYKLLFINKSTSSMRTKGNIFKINTDKPIFKEVEQKCKHTDDDRYLKIV